MDANQLNELATNARLNHWPPHLGVVTEAEKVEYLAQQISTIIETGDAEIVSLEDRVKFLEGESMDLQNTIDARDDKIDRLESKIDDLTEENQRLRDELTAKTEEPNV